MNNQNGSSLFPEESPGKILALDYGKAKIGVAISDAEHTMVFGRGVIDCTKGLKGFFEQMQVWCKEDNITTIVIGLPFDLDARETTQTRLIRRFSKKLEDFLGTAGIHVFIKFEDESFTSFEADEHLAELGFKTKRSKKHEDELAAVLILRRYLKRKK